MQKSLHSDDYQHFLEELRDARLNAGVTQEQLAAALAEHQTLVSKVERGLRRLDVVELRAWLAALDIKLLDFVGHLEERIERHNRPAAGKTRK